MLDLTISIEVKGSHELKSSFQSIWLLLTELGSSAASGPGSASLQKKKKKKKKKKKNEKKKLMIFMQ